MILSNLKLIKELSVKDSVFWKTREELKASGIAPEKGEIMDALEDITEELRSMKNYMLKEKVLKPKRMKKKSLPHLEWGYKH